jgi:16S rRNA (uracil1498-N3)-methyltransferase
MHRFFIPSDWVDRDRVVIKGRQVHQLRDVLRLGIGDRIVVLDNTGREYEIELDDVVRGHVAGVVRRTSLVVEPRTSVTVYQALLKGSKFEFIIQKCTELGVARFVPMLCERCAAREISGVSASKLERWRRIILEAAEQSGRGKLPMLEPVVPFEQACQSAVGFSLLPWEEEKTLGLRAPLQDEINHRGDLLSVNLFIGPEGGFTPSEVDFARNCGIAPVTLGSRVLRAETAGLVAASAVFYECGELDPLPSY